MHPRLTVTGRRSKIQVNPRNPARSSMRPDEVSRRDFHKLSTAALCGLIAGTAFGCADQSSPPPAKTTSSTTPPPTAPPTAPAASVKTDAKADGKSAVAVTTVALHACRGLNECK